MGVCDALGQCEAKPEGARPRREEGSKDPFVELGRNTGTLIQDLEAYRVGRRELLHQELDRTPARARFERVVEQGGQRARQ